jgi:predicted Zn finger-like uncharacterized protein
MPISTTCPSCKAIFRLAEELAGKKVKCQKCQSLFVVPAGEAGTMEPGVYVPEDAMLTSVESPAGKTQPAATRPEDIPVMARFAVNEVDRDDNEERRTPTKPRRDERRPRRDEQPKPRSGLLPIVLALCGLGLFSCIVLIGGIALWHLVADRPAPPRPMIGMGNRKQAFAPQGMAKNGLPGGFNQDPVRPVNKTPATEIKLGADGIFRQESELTVQDPLNPDQKRHKHYAIQLEEGKRYQIDLQSAHFDAFLFLLDDANKIVAENDDVEPPGGAKPHNQDSRIVYAPLKTGLFKIEATFFDNSIMGDGRQLGPFTLTIRELKK